MNIAFRCRSVRRSNRKCYCKLVETVRKLVQSQFTSSGINSFLYYRNYSEESFGKKFDGCNDKIDLSSFPLEKIRNFSIIAHIDHGKSTLADRILELTGAIDETASNQQVLDKLQVEKERGITVKAQSASLVFHYNNQDYLLNLIDTPGHVDFVYEVSRSLSACQGAILLVDANQGVQAQTVANFYLAFTQELAIIPVLNKIDLKNANPHAVTEQMVQLFEIDSADVLRVSAKLGTGVVDVLKAVVDRVPSPEKFCNRHAPMRSLLYDSWYDRYKGVVCQVLVVDGELNVGDQIQSFHTGKSYDVKTVAYMSPTEVSVQTLYTGQIGIFTANIRKTSEARVGDTFHKKGHTVDPLPGFKEAKPMVYAGVYPMDPKDRNNLKAAIEKLALNDSSVSMSIESSEALGQGWRMGFLGLLHMDVFNTRLEQEYGAQVVMTTPSVPYKVKRILPLNAKKMKRGSSKEEDLERIINNPAHWPENQQTETFEPMVKGTIISPANYAPSIIEFCEGRRGEQIDVIHLDQNRTLIIYKLPLSEIIVDFFDHLKSLSSGYATFDYEDIGYEPTNLVKLTIKLNGTVVEELSTIVPKSHAAIRGRQICLKLTETLPRQLFQIAVQACIGATVIARENIRAVRKDVLAKCYGGDVTRKMKLLKRQAEGKRKMKLVGNIEIPRETFIDVLKK